MNQSCSGPTSRLLHKLVLPPSTLFSPSPLLSPFGFLLDQRLPQVAFPDCPPHQALSVPHQSIHYSVL